VPRCGSRQRPNKKLFVAPAGTDKSRCRMHGGAVGSARRTPSRTDDLRVKLSRNAGRCGRWCRKYAWPTSPDNQPPSASFLFVVSFAQSNAGTATVLVEKFDASCLKDGPKTVNCGLPRIGPLFNARNGVGCDASFRS